jgi:hypothetical protein
MSARPMQPHPLPPVRRDYEGSRLEAQQVISAYECVIPVIRRLLNPIKVHLSSAAPEGPPAGCERQSEGHINESQ